MSINIKRELIDLGTSIIGEVMRAALSGDRSTLDRVGADLLAARAERELVQRSIDAAPAAAPAPAPPPLPGRGHPSPTAPTKKY